jgi:hypothetical protein
MYNKIASIILNSSKAAGLSDVFVAQPDALKENLAGKIFVLAEISGKKIEAKRVFDFLISALDNNYYNDEKILFRDKIEGLKIENIFEAAIAKTNKQVIDFLLAEKIKLNAASTSITLGVVFEDKLHFSNFGRNRSVLIYPKAGSFDLINVEANATDTADSSEEGLLEQEKIPKLFSSVISGELPVGSYFMFGSEALLEYLSSKELINIVTKLPPITAAEQIKNVLNKINNYVPFLGIIIKNTVGLSMAEVREEAAAASLAQPNHVATSSLNYTEQKTEQMLAPAGLINFSKLAKSVQVWLAHHWAKTQLKPATRKYSGSLVKTEVKTAEAILDLGTVKSLNLARSDSFLKSEKIFFKNESGVFMNGLKKTWSYCGALFNPQLLRKLLGSVRDFATGLNLRNRSLFIVLGSLVLLLAVSISVTRWNHSRQLAQDNFNNLVSQIEDKSSNIASHLLYNDEVGAQQSLVEAQALLAALPQQTTEQKAVYQRLSVQMLADQEKLQKTVKATPPVKVADFAAGFAARNLALAGGKLFANSNQEIYSFKAGSTSYEKTKITGVSNLKFLNSDQKDKLYYANNNQLVEFAVKARTSAILSLGEAEPALTSGQAAVFNGSLYALRASQNQIYKYGKVGNNLGTKTAWLKESSDLSLGSSLLVDGDIYVLQVNGQVLKFYKNKKAEYKSAPVAPAITKAQKILAGQNYLYIWEPTSRRLVVLSRKDGHLASQYTFDTLVNPIDFAVEESTKTVYFLTVGSVWKTQLK